MLRSTRSYEVLPVASTTGSARRVSWSASTNDLRSSNGQKRSVLSRALRRLTTGIRHRQEHPQTKAGVTRIGSGDDSSGGRAGLARQWKSSFSLDTREQSPWSSTDAFPISPAATPHSSPAVERARGFASALTGHRARSANISVSPVDRSSISPTSKPRARHQSPQHIPQIATVMYKRLLPAEFESLRESKVDPSPPHSSSSDDDETYVTSGGATGGIKPPKHHRHHHDQHVRLSHRDSHRSYETVTPSPSPTDDVTSGRFRVTAVHQQPEPDRRGNSPTPDRPDAPQSPSPPPVIAARPEVGVTAVGVVAEPNAWLRSQQRLLHLADDDDDDEAESTPPNNATTQTTTTTIDGQEEKDGRVERDCGRTSPYLSVVCPVSSFSERAPANVVEEITGEEEEEEEEVSAGQGERSLLVAGSSQEGHRDGIGLDSSKEGNPEAAATVKLNAKTASGIVDAADTDRVDSSGGGELLLDDRSWSAAEVEKFSTSPQINGSTDKSFPVQAKETKNTIFQPKATDHNQHHFYNNNNKDAPDIQLRPDRPKSFPAVAAAEKATDKQRQSRHPASVTAFGVRVLPSAPSSNSTTSFGNSVASPDTFRLPRARLRQQVLPAAPVLGVEEDYENDSRYVITETDLGEISPSSLPAKPARPLVPVRPYTAATPSRLVFCRRMLDRDQEHQPEERIAEGRNREEREIPAVKYRPPSQVIRLIQKFENRISSSPEIEVTSTENRPLASENESPIISPVPPLLTPTSASGRTPSPSSPTPSSSPASSCRNSVIFVERPDPAMTTTTTDENHHNRRYNDATTRQERETREEERETSAVLEQLDQSIDEVILSDEDLARTVPLQNADRWRHCRIGGHVTPSDDTTENQEPDTTPATKVTATTVDASVNTDFDAVPEVEGANEFNNAPPTLPKPKSPAIVSVTTSSNPEHPPAGVDWNMAESPKSNCVPALNKWAPVRNLTMSTPNRSVPTAYGSPTTGSESEKSGNEPPTSGSTTQSVPITSQTGGVNGASSTEKIASCITGNGQLETGSRWKPDSGYSWLTTPPKSVGSPPTFVNQKANAPVSTTSTGSRGTGVTTNGTFTAKINGRSSSHQRDSSGDNGVSEESGPSDVNTPDFSHRMSTATLDGAVVARQRNSDAGEESGMQDDYGAPGHFVVVAIDFGTTFSGYAFCFTRDPDNIHVMRKWQVDGDTGMVNHKTPTTLLLTPEGVFHSIGFAARDFYHNLDGADVKKWLYFHKFKMTLHHDTNLSSETEVKAANGVKMSALTVFAHVLRHFKDQALHELSDQSATRLVNEDVRWVITVPAIWRQPAKQFMREAAYLAGIASRQFPDQLLIALEPEAASIYCRKLKVHQRQQLDATANRPTWKTKMVATIDTDADSATIGQMTMDDMQPGTRYMVVDCGGGTVDITVHELADNNGNLKELHKPTGGACGSVSVDTEFENLLNDIFGADFLEQFKRQRPAGFVNLMMAFEARKRNVSPSVDTWSNVSLPFSFVEYYKKCKNCSVESAIKKHGRKDIRWSYQGMLRIDADALRGMFSGALAELERHVARVLAATDHTVRYLFLVGGFAESRLLQQAVRRAFERPESKLRVLVPPDAGLAVLKGAVLFGLEPTAVAVRKSRLTYGVGVLNRFRPEVHPIGKRIVRGDAEWCTDVFDAFVSVDQPVALGDVVLRSYTPARAGQTAIVLHVYSSENEEVAFITDPGVRRCGRLHLDLSDVRYATIGGGGGKRPREIQARMVFGDTEIKISALDVASGKSVGSLLDFLNH